MLCCARCCKRRCGRNSKTHLVHDYIEKTMEKQLSKKQKWVWAVFASKNHETSSGMGKKLSLEPFSFIIKKTFSFIIFIIFLPDLLFSSFQEQTGCSYWREEEKVESERGRCFPLFAWLCFKSQYRLISPSYMLSQVLLELEGLDKEVLYCFSINYCMFNYHGCLRLSRKCGSH